MSTKKIQILGSLGTGGEKIYKQNEEPENAAVGTLWVDMDAEAENEAPVINVDTTLTQAGQAADAKATGDAIALAKSEAIEHAENQVNGLTAEDVGARPNTWMPSAAEVGARPNTWLPTIADIGAAPSGHGLGGWAELGSWAGIDGLTANGWYRFDSINVTINNVGVVSALVRVDWYYGSYGTQTLYAVNSGSGSNEIPVLKRTCGYAGWQPWECVNPPMEVGKEYRTIKRYVNKPVYTMAVNCGAMPNTSYKEVAYSVPSGSVKNVISCRGTTSQGDALPYVSNRADYRICATPTYIQITTNADKSPYTAVAIIEYIKN